MLEITRNLIIENGIPNRAISEVYIGTIKYNALWDTGATNTVVNREVIEGQCELFSYVKPATLQDYNSEVSDSSEYTVNLGFICDNESVKNINVTIIDRAREDFNQGHDIIIGLDIILKQKFSLNKGRFKLIFSECFKIINERKKHILCTGIGINDKEGVALLDTANIITMVHSKLLSDEHRETSYFCNDFDDGNAMANWYLNCFDRQCINCRDQKRTMNGNNLFLTLTNESEVVNLSMLQENINNHPFERVPYNLILGMEFILQTELKIQDNTISMFYRSIEINTEIRNL